MVDHLLAHLAQRLAVGLFELPLLLPRGTVFSRQRGNGNSATPLASTQAHQMSAGGVTEVPLADHPCTRTGLAAGQLPHGGARTRALRTVERGKAGLDATAGAPNPTHRMRVHIEGHVVRSILRNGGARLWGRLRLWSVLRVEVKIVDAPVWIHAATVSASG